MTDKLADNLKQDFLRSIPVGRFGGSEEVAEAVSFLAGPAAGYITGQVINVNGGLLMA
jgi:3-oxoacyl-[acyl-carrier protein] reductase